jgi:hypothetical protein
MKYLAFIIFFFLNGQIQGQEKVYDLDINAKNGRKFKTAEFQSKKVVIVFEPAEKAQNKSTADLLESIKDAFPLVELILVPVIDAKNKADSVFEKDGVSINSLKFTVSKLLIQNSAKNTDENRLVKWLTNRAENQHFDVKEISGEHWFFISESGILYASIEGDINMPLIRELLSQKDVLK